MYDDEMEQERARYSKNNILNISRAEHYERAIVNAGTHRYGLCFGLSSGTYYILSESECGSAAYVDVRAYIENSGKLIHIALEPQQPEETYKRDFCILTAGISFDFHSISASRYEFYTPCTFYN